MINRKHRLWWRHNKKYVWLFVFLIIGILIGTALACRPEPKLISPCPDTGCFTPQPTEIPAKVEPMTSLEPTRRRYWVGKVSYYSRDGCMGCNSDLITASGEILSDTDLTIAFNHLPMGTKVKVTNMRNNQSVIARVNDTGGFYRYGRIADLNLATKNTIDAKTDMDIITIEAL